MSGESGATAVGSGGTGSGGTASGGTPSDGTPSDGTPSDGTGSGSTAPDTSQQHNSGSATSETQTGTAPARAHHSRHPDRHDSGVADEATGSVAHGPRGFDVSGTGGFTASQLSRIDEALTLSSMETGLTFSLYVGNLDEPTRRHAETLFDTLAGTVEGPVLVAVSPGQRVLHIVTGEASVTRLPNRACALAALAMRASFSSGDLTGGLVTGLRMLADAAGHGPSR